MLLIRYGREIVRRSLQGTYRLAMSGKVMGGDVVDSAGCGGAVVECERVLLRDEQLVHLPRGGYGWGVLTWKTRSAVLVRWGVRS